MKIRQMESGICKTSSNSIPLFFTLSSSQMDLVVGKGKVRHFLGIFEGKMQVLVAISENEILLKNEKN